MTALQQEARNCIDELPDHLLRNIIPLLKSLTDSAIYVENVRFEDLTESEKQSVIKAEEEFKRGETVNFEDYLKERGIAID